MPSYTDLQTYRRCLRLYGFGLLGYTPIETPEPLQTGSLVHTAIASHFRGTDWIEAIQRQGNDIVARLEKLDSSEKQAKALKELETSLKRAKELAARYIQHWASDYTACLVEPELTPGNVVCHPDLIACYQEQRVIVDFKTSRNPDIRWYDVSGQVDLYAYVHNETSVNANLTNLIQLVIYDIISDEGIFKHVRPPRLEAGMALHNHIELLPTSTNYIGDKHYNNFEPHFQFDCPQRCQFWTPCWLLETADWQSCEDYLESNYIKEGSNAGIKN